MYSRDRNNPMGFKDLEKALFEGEDHWTGFEQAFEGVHPGFEPQPGHMR
ncbi:MAG: hypothetical protein IKM99_09190 [Bacteroidales bacterium]|nr:hypothetical protein [Bacteroidales bacterium]